MARTRLAGAMLAAVVLAGCGEQAAPPPAPSAADGSPQDALTGSPLPLPPSGPQAEEQAADAAKAAVAAYVRKGEEVEQWASELSRRMTPEASADYLGADLSHPTTDPDNVPGTKVTGTPEVVADAESQYLMWARVRTDAGNYQVLLQANPDSQLPNPWLVVKIVPPEPDS